MASLANPEFQKMLESWEQKLGRVDFLENIKRYRLRKTDAGVLPTPRERTPQAWLDKAFLLQRGKCWRCRKAMELGDVEADHRIPLAKGGKHEKRNIVAMCGECNRRKGANDPVEEAKRTGRTVLENMRGATDEKN